MKNSNTRDGQTALSIEERLERIEQLIASQVTMQKPNLSIDEVAAYTGYSKQYIYKLTHLNKIPFYKPNGKTIFFKREEIDAWLLRNRTATDEEIQNEAVNSIVNGK